MSISNLSIVFGPTLLIGAGRDGTFNLDHTPLQSKVRRYAQRLSRAS